MIGNLAYSKVNVKKNKSFFYYGAFAFIICIYFILFNANNILPDNTTIMNSSLGKEIDVGSTKFSINRWEYNKDKKFMEVELSYKDSGDYIATKFKFSAKAKVNVKKQLTVKTMLNTDSIYIVQIENIPKDYEAIALKVSQDTSSALNTDIDTSNISTDDFSTSNFKNTSADTNNTIKNNFATLYCDYRKVKINNTLKSETQKYYIINMSKTEIKNINNNVITINNKVKSNEGLINMANEKINTLNSQYKYEIKAEQDNTNQEINSYKAKIQAIRLQNASLEITKASLIDKIAKVKQKINDIKNPNNKASVKNNEVAKITHTEAPNKAVKKVIKK